MSKTKNKKIKKSPNFLKQKTWGFTLIEMIVSVGLFTVVVFVAIGSLTSIVTASKKVQSIKIVMDNLNFAVESMVREMRIGSVYHCGTTGDLTAPNDCPSSGKNSMAFRHKSGNTYVFRISSEGRLQKSKNGGSTYLDMTAPELEINKLQFFVRGSVEGDGFRPRVLVIIEGTAGVKAIEKTTFRIQTTISQRLINS